MGIYAVKPKFQKILKPLESFLIHYKIHPTIINVIALVLSVIGGLILFFADQNIWLLLYIPFMGFFRTAFNALDGMIARTLQVKNQSFGEVLNETLDRTSDAVIFIGLAFATYTNIYLGIITLTIILINSYLSIVSKAAGGQRQYGGIMGKADRMIVLGFMAAAILVWQELSFANYFLWFICIGIIITFFQRFYTIKKELYK